MVQYGVFYGVVLNVGLICDGVFFVLIDEDWDDVVFILLNGFYNVLKFLMMLMICLKKGGCIVILFLVFGIMGN